jgi:hypothetical protein
MLIEFLELISLATAKALRHHDLRTKFIPGRSVFYPRKISHLSPEDRSSIPGRSVTYPRKIGHLSPEDRSLIPGRSVIYPRKIGRVRINSETDLGTKTVCTGRACADLSPEDRSFIPGRSVKIRAKEKSSENTNIPRNFQDFPIYPRENGPDRGVDSELIFSNGVHRSPGRADLSPEDRSWRGPTRDCDLSPEDRSLRQAGRF